jgi:cell division protein FtsN
VGRALPHLLALLLGVAAALAIGCGDRSNLIPGDAAGELKAQLAAVKAAVDGGDCPSAEAAIDRASARYQELPASVDSRLKKRIGDGIRALRESAPTDCQAAQTQTETTPTETQTTPTETQTTPTETQTTPTATTPTETTPPTTTETTPPATTPQTTPSATSPNGGTPGEVPTP